MERDLSEAEELRRQISSAERALENTGSTRSNQEVVDDLARLDKQMWVQPVQVNRDILSSLPW